MIRKGTESGVKMLDGLKRIFSVCNKFGTEAVCNTVCNKGGTRSVKRGRSDCFFILLGLHHLHRCDKIISMEMGIELGGFPVHVADDGFQRG